MELRGFQDAPFSSRHFASFRPGTIDYTPQQESIRTLLEAMEKSRVCKIAYRAILAKKSKTFYIKPYRLFSHQDTVYLHAGLARKPGALYKEPELMAWLLSFGDEARLLGPDWLVEKVKGQVARMEENYRV